MSELTYISATQISNYTTLEALQETIIRTIARWFDIHEAQWSLSLPDGVYKLCGMDRIQAHFELNVVDTHICKFTMYAIGRFRRHGSSCDFFEMVFNNLLHQIQNPDREFLTMEDARFSKAQEYRSDLDFGTPLCYTHSSSVSGALPVAGAFSEMVVYDEDDESVASLEEDAEDAEESESDEEDDSDTVASLEEDEDESESDEEDESESDEDSEEEDEEDESESDDEEHIMSMPLRDMTDAQIEKYIDNLGREPSREVEDWTMEFKGGAISRYSYVKFADTTIADQRVFNVTIRCARFSGCTLSNFVFEQVHFAECDFKSVIIENVTFKDCQFTECDLDLNTLGSCTLETVEIDGNMYNRRR
jgi:hypothetical protein